MRQCRTSCIIQISYPGWFSVESTDAPGSVTASAAALMCTLTETKYGKCKRPTAFMTSQNLLMNMQKKKKRINRNNFPAKTCFDFFSSVWQLFVVGVCSCTQETQGCLMLSHTCT